MKDLAIVQPYTLLPFESISQEGNFFRVKGPEDYSNVVAAVINDMIIEEVAIYGRDLLIYIPSDMDGETGDVRYVALISVETESSDETMLRLGLGAIPSEVEGVDRLIQLFVKVLFQTPGTDIFYRSIGGGLKELRKGATFGDINSLSADIAASARKAERDVKGMQAGMKLPGSERLVKIDVLKIRPDSGTGDVNVLLSLTTVSGVRSFFNVAA
jgi:hypothetical protein